MSDQSNSFSIVFSQSDAPPPISMWQEAEEAICHLIAELWMRRCEGVAQGKFCHSSPLRGRKDVSLSFLKPLATQSRGEANELN